MSVKWRFLLTLWRVGGSHFPVQGGLSPVVGGLCSPAALDVPSESKPTRENCSAFAVSARLVRRGMK